MPNLVKKWWHGWNKCFLPRKQVKFPPVLCVFYEQKRHSIPKNSIFPSRLGMQRAGKFPGILETFHGKFREFWRGGNFRKFWEFSIVTYFQHFMRLFAQKSTELNFLCTLFKHTRSALLFWQFVGLYGSIERTTRLYYEITLDLIC